MNCDNCKLLIDDGKYGLRGNDEKICYKCCAELDKEYMRKNGKITLYLTCEQVKRTRPRKCRGEVTNWPGSLRFSCHTRSGRHNIVGNRYDCWFVFEGYEWHGVTYGDNTQICHCKKTKVKA